ncbi:hypothetical protein SAMD00019534_110020 [Acytostelium subglobosum LB1]|uniref:hypothetical protein n=1 Tax=Acytostelium subglobosum LB1 TaxID=1410327 RepID=UPI0006449054|nr:hypothetical protein SAMD00019534_110020 [Acytostelium subglobosum LB1]GAM27826.1 hypothetical protein SAMD00019534_110020 [Acytostelium subglobosum LB1]|eukprot:XP_012749109.1 hypothetical protein SAMD00019534_110020 [Acytostelium subglobosum LB1]
MYHNQHKDAKYPSTLTTIIFGPKYNQWIFDRTPPQSVTSLTFDCSYERTINYGDLPGSLKYLKLPSYSEEVSSGRLPPGLTTLILGGEYFHELRPGTLPQSITSLSLGDASVKGIKPGVLPSSLTELKLSKFNANIKPGVVPTGLLTMTFSSYSSFNEELPPRVLPPTLQLLSLPLKYDQPFCIGSLPESLTTLIIQRDEKWDNIYSHAFEPGVLPASLKTFELPKFSKIVDSSPFPALSFYTELDKEDRKYERENENDEYGGYDRRRKVVKDDEDDDDDDDDDEKYDSKDNPPPLPSSIKTLVFNGYLQNGYIPNSVEKLLLRTCNYRFESGHFPQSIKTLELGVCLRQPRFLELSLPRSFTKLVLGNSYSEPITPGILPDSITHLEIGKKYTSGYEKDALPASLTCLKLAGAQKSGIFLPPKKLLYLAITSLPQIHRVKGGVDHLSVTNASLTTKDSTAAPLLTPIRTLSIRATGTAFKNRSQFLKTIFRIVPNVDCYDIAVVNKAEDVWSTQLRKLDQWRSIIVTDHHTIQYFNNAPVERVTYLEELVKQLSKENETLKTENEEMRAQLDSLRSSSSKKPARSTIPAPSLIKIKVEDNPSDEATTTTTTTTTTTAAVKREPLSNKRRRK